MPEVYRILLLSMSLSDGRCSSPCAMLGDTFIFFVTLSLRTCSPHYGQILSLGQAEALLPPKSQIN